MKKKLVVLSLILVMCSMLCACACRTCDEEYSINCPDCYHGCLRCDECLSYHTCDECYDGKNTIVCPVCNALGKVRNPMTWEEFECMGCNGKGQVEEECEECDGWGVNYDDYDECSKEYEKGDLTCPTCEGKGEIDCPDC